MKWSSVLVALAVILTGTAFGVGGCGSPEAVRLYRNGGYTVLPDAGRGSGGVPTFGSGGAPTFGSGGAPTFGSGGAPTFGTGGAPSSGGAPGTGGAVGTGGRASTGGAVGTGGSVGSGGRAATGGAGGGAVGTGGSVGSGGRAATGGAGGGAVGTGGRSGTGGAGGGTCITNIRGAGYTADGHACSACSDHGMSLATKCMSMIDCLSPQWPSCMMNVNCWSDCLNKFGDSVLGTCVQQIVAVCN